MFIVRFTYIMKCFVQLLLTTFQGPFLLKNFSFVKPSIEVTDYGWESKRCLLKMKSYCLLNKRWKERRMVKRLKWNDGKLLFHEWSWFWSCSLGFLKQLGNICLLLIIFFQKTQSKHVLEWICNCFFYFCIKWNSYYGLNYF